MNRTFDPFHDIDRLFAEAARTPASVAMPMDLYRDGDKYVAAIDLPGVDPASIDIDVEEGTLTIRAERRSHAGEDAQWLSRDRISADYSDGVLSLTIPVAEAAKPRKIQVQHGTSGTNEIA